MRPPVFSIHISDWNLNDRVLVYKDSTVPLQILRDKSLKPEDRMSKLYSAADRRKDDPRASEIDDADLFIPWPGDAIGFINGQAWEDDVAGSLADLDDVE